ncbi:hypothetical protein [Dokdonella ginsengisoli]|uniref:hypothetical protein n=1 Tax=Dokdonella ginsengisoli TaxID=363846 RepID=UPI0036D3950E
MLTIAPAMVGAILLASWGGLLLLLTIAKRPDWLPSPHGISIEHLGQFGDAFAPVTALFALIAAVGAWHSYEAQRQQLEDERKRNRTQRFDDVFFKLLSYYDDKINRSIRPLMNDLRAYVSGTEDPRVSERERWLDSLYKVDRFEDLTGLAAQVRAIVGWLRSSSAEDIVSHVDLLDAHLSDVELWFWQRAIADKGDESLVAAGVQWRIFGDAQGMTADAARAFKAPSKVTEEEIAT